MVDVRTPGASDLNGLVALKIAWSGRDRVGDEERADFAAVLARWMEQMGPSLVCRIAVEEDRVIGMAWLVVYPRVPNLGDPVRRSGDVQSVLVLPEHRGTGIGSALVASLLEEADRRDVPRVTVHSSPAAVPLYERAGFAATPRLLARPRPTPD